MKLYIDQISGGITDRETGRGTISCDLTLRTDDGRRVVAQLKNDTTTLVALTVSVLTHDKETAYGEFTLPMKSSFSEMLMAAELNIRKVAFPI